ncbi:MAG: LEA type 2 family protein [Pseudomonadota bacterium]
MTSKFYLALFCVFLIMTVGCASLQSGYETPVVTITSFEPIPTNGFPQFKIGLHIVNPNRTPLELKGVSYTIALEGHKILTGVSNKLPHIEAYGEGDIELNASVDLFSSIGFFSDLIKNHQRETFAYSFTAKLDAGTFHPLIRVAKEGKFSLSGNNP